MVLRPAPWRLDGCEPHVVRFTPIDHPGWGVPGRSSARGGLDEKKWLSSIKLYSTDDNHTSVV